MKNLEIEFKWDANSVRAFKRMEKAVVSSDAQIGSVQEIKIVDRYVDTPTHDFEKDKIAMRIREIDNKHWEATFKTRTEIVGGKAVRREETCALPGVKNFREALRALQENKKWKGLNVSKVRPIFTLRNMRIVYPVSFHRMKAELSFDTCQLRVCGRQIFFKEIELELKQGSADALVQLATLLTQETGLTPARISKVKTAVTLLRLWEKQK